MKLSDYPIAKFIKVVIAGQPGRGKSCCGLTFPLPMKIFDFDGKLDGPILFAKKHGIDISQIDVEQVGNWQAMQRILDQELNNTKFASYGFDSLTVMADMLLNQIGDVKSKEGKVKLVAGMQVPGIDEYNAESAGIMDLLLFMKTVKAHVWLSAHVIETKTNVLGDKGASVVVNRQLLTGGKKAAAKIPAYFPENYSIQIENSPVVGDKPKFFVYTSSNSEDYGRTGFNLPYKFEITNKLFYPTLLSLITQPGA